MNLPGYAKQLEAEAKKGEDGNPDGKPAAPTNKVLIYATSKDGAIRELVNGRSRSKYETGFQYT